MENSDVILSYTFSGTVAEIILVLVIFTVINISFHVIVAIKQQRMISRQQNMLETKEEFISLMAAKQHEFNKHIQMINSLAEKEDDNAVKAIKEYTDELIERSAGNVGKVVYVGDGLLSAYFARKTKEAEEKGIELSVLVMTAMEKLPCSSTETIEILGNLLDNAFEAVENLDAIKRKIFLEVYEEKDHVIIQTMNHIPRDFSIGKAQADRRGFSTKGRGMQRGHGLANVKEIAEQYGGRVMFNANEEVVSVKVVLS